MLAAKNAHARDACIQFFAEGHKYVLTIGNTVKTVGISSTTFIHHFFPSFDPGKVIAGMQRKSWPRQRYTTTLAPGATTQQLIDDRDKADATWDKAFEEFCKTGRKGPRWALTKDFGKLGAPAGLRAMEATEIQDLWTENGNQASAAGTIMHDTIERFYNGETIEFDTPELRMFKQFHENVIIGPDPANPRYRPFRTEWLIFHEEYDIAGAIDFIAQDTRTGAFKIFDWKRSKEIRFDNPWEKEPTLAPVAHLPHCNYQHYRLQQNLYKYILGDVYDVDVQEIAIVVLHPNADTYKVINFTDTDEGQKEIHDMLETRRAPFTPSSSCDVPFSSATEVAVKPAHTHPSA